MCLEKIRLRAQNTSTIMDSVVNIYWKAYMIKEFIDIRYINMYK